MKNIKNFAKGIIAIIVLTININCTQKNNKTKIVASTGPIAWVLKSLADTSVVEVITLVDSTQISAEMFEPTPRHIAQLTKAKAFFSTTLLDYEQIIGAKLTNTTIIDLCRGIDLIHGQCGSCCAGSNSEHSHGVDPHIWLSPGCMATITKTAANELQKLGILKKGAMDSVLNIIHNIDSRIKKKADTAKEVTGFAIVHPSLGYFAREYSLEQVALEVDGKEPSLRSMKNAIAQIRENRIRTVFCNDTENSKAARIVADETGAVIVGFNPLCSDWPTTIKNLGDAIYQGTN